MNICLLGQFPPHIGGVSSHTYLLARELSKRGDKVYVLTYPFQDIRDQVQVLENHIKDQKGISEEPHIKDLDDITVETAFTVNIKGLRGFLFFISASFKLFSITRRYDIDLIHAHFLLPPGLIAVLVGRLTRKRVAVTVHGSDIFIQASKPLLGNLIKYVLKKADIIAVVDETVAEKIKELEIKGVSGKIKITPNAVDLEKFNPQNKTSLPEEIGLNPQKPVILFVGNLVPQKGLMYLLEAKKQMKTPAQLVIVGDGPLRYELQEMVKKDKIEDVYFTGARRDVNQIMPTADIFILPSTSEGFPITLIEALASGLPAVATNVGGVKELVTPDVGYTVEPGDPNKLKESIEEILNDDKKMSRMAEAAVIKARKYGKLKVPY